MTSLIEDEQAIAALLERWAAAVHARDIEAILADHSDNVVMFDVPPPFRSVGLDEYRATSTFFEWTRDATVFDIVDLTVVAGGDVAFAYASMRSAGLGDDGTDEDLDFRLTVGLSRKDGRWQIVHEHHSIPAD